MMSQVMETSKGDEVVVPEEGNKLFDLHQAGRVLGLSKTAVYNHIKRGQIKAVRLGNLWRVGAEELRRIQSEGF